MTSRADLSAACRGSRRWRCSVTERRGSSDVRTTNTLQSSIRLNPGVHERAAFAGATPREGGTSSSAGGRRPSRGVVHRGVVNILVGFGSLKPAGFAVIALPDAMSTAERISALRGFPSPKDSVHTLHGKPRLLRSIEMLCLRVVWFRPVRLLALLEAGRSRRLQNTPPPASPAQVSHP
jgi:hypothetical protein